MQFIPRNSIQVEKGSFAQLLLHKFSCYLSTDKILSV